MKYLTIKQMKEVDRLMIKKYSITLLQMMENAGRILAKVVMKFRPKKVSILVGPGNNGGGGLVCARYLHNKGIKVNIVLSTTKLNKISRQHLKTAKMLNIPIKDKIEGDVIVDALLGYNAKGSPKGKIAKLIKEANSKKKPIVSLDVPTGLDLSTGKYYTNSFKKSTIVTIAKPKVGMENIKKMYVADIGIPKEIFKKIKK